MLNMHSSTALSFFFLFFSLLFTFGVESGRLGGKVGGGKVEGGWGGAVVGKFKMSQR